MSKGLSRVFYSTIVLFLSVQNKIYLTYKCLEKVRKICRGHGLGMLSKDKMGWCSFC